jgi:uncharacterized membrane protein (DUF2068 family)
LIVAYKLGKAVLELGLGVLLWVLIAQGLAANLAELSRAARAHVASRTGGLLAAALGEATASRLHYVAIALVADGLLSGVEGWVLARGYRVGPWLVVAATGLPLPVELVEVIRDPRPTRVLLLLANGAIVVYLTRSIARRAARRLAS